MISDNPQTLGQQSESHYPTERGREPVEIARPWLTEIIRGLWPIVLLAAMIIAGTVASIWLVR